MAIRGMFFNAVKEGDVYDRTYNAEDFSDYLDKIVGNGVFPNPSTSMQVRAAEGMDVAVGIGEGWIDGHKIIITADEALTVDAADSLLDRIDRVIFYCDYTDREMGVEILKGEKSATPVAPALTRNSSRYEMSLATILVSKQVTAISAAAITDTRADSNVCGWATGIIQQVDTSTLFLQWEAAYAAYYADIKQQLDDFIETLTQELSVNTYVVSYQKTATIAGSATSPSITLDMESYTYDATDTIFVYINGLLADPSEYQVSSGGIITLDLDGKATQSSTVDIRVLKTRIAIDHI